MQRGLTTNNELLEEIDIVKNHFLRTMMVNQRAVKKNTSDLFNSHSELIEKQNSMKKAQSGKKEN
ncbi:MAG: hypothetical protein E7Z79_05335 [Methanobrevibacter thaueri]|uniref:Uncharacterized protein n=1 Tax=Methanobrevibacter thaueri TaxID=190975 RepID=A0A8T3V864_9EURY|nr:hypothetical protein [Methanobrevibacter thaueri]MBE6501846.1 hypothetical protein [Methanobrevibacter thaueri]